MPLDRHDRRTASSATIGSRSNHDPRRREQPLASSSSSSSPLRKIYSPYPPPPPDSLSSNEESTFTGTWNDHVGTFVADTADRVFGETKNDEEDDDDDDDDVDKLNPNEATKRTTTTTTATGAAARASSTQRHWKDRLQERLDYLLGIHEDGEFYNRWATQAAAAAARDKEQDGPWDAFAVAQGRTPPKRRSSSDRRNKKYDKPIWETEGNLISLLFGRRPSGDSLLFDRLLNRDGGGTLLYFFQAAFRTFLLLFSILCRWASVRGSIPQPVVVIGVATAGLCARPRHRWRAIALTLVVLRTAGELIHGTIYGNDGWNDDDTDDQDDGEHE